MATGSSLVGWVETRYSKKKGMWQARLRWRPSPGPVVTVASFLHEREDEARRLAADAQLALSQRVRVQMLDPRSRAAETTVAEFVNSEYVPHRLPQLAPNTARTYRETLRRWVAGYLGGYRLSELNRRVGQAWVEWMEEQGASRATQEKALTVAKAVVTHARKRDFLDPNLAHPFALVELTLPVVHAGPSPLALGMLEVEQIVAQMPGDTDALFTRLVGEIGLRQQEAVALVWRDALDESGRARARLRVERAVSGRGRDRVTKEPKTTSGDRRPLLFEPVGRDIEALWRKRGEPALDSPIFPAQRASSADGLFDPKNWLRRVFYPALEAAGIPRQSSKYGTITPHRLRAACASALGHAGWSLAEVGAQIGHSTGNPTTLLKHYYRAIAESHAPLRGVSPEEQIRLARASAKE